MFLKELNKEEAIAFTNLMSEFVLADEEVGKGEEALMERLFNEIGFRIPVISPFCMTASPQRPILCPPGAVI